MHGILALSALDLAASGPFHLTKYVSSGDRHQALAMSSYRQCLLNVTEVSKDAVLTMATILPMLSLARATLMASRTAELQTIGADSLRELFYLIRDVAEIYSATMRLGDCGFVSVVLGYAFESDARVEKFPKISEVFANLERMVRDSCMDPNRQKPCLEAALHLHGLFETMLFQRLSGNLKTFQIWRWGLMVSPEFIKLVGEEFPPALVITAYFIVATSLSQDQNLMREWANLAFQGIQVALRGQLGEEMVWAGEQIATDNAGLKCAASSVQ